MLAIKVELHPYGDEKYAKNIGNLLIYNDGEGTVDIGNYGVLVVEDGVTVAQAREELLHGVRKPTAFVRNYQRRKLPVFELVAQALVNAGYGIKDD